MTSINDYTITQVLIPTYDNNNINYSYNTIYSIVY